jgi:hypothetical protein
MAEDSPATSRRQHGHSRAYILDRLKRENQTDLAAAVEAGTVSAFAAAVQCGWTKRPPSAAAVTHQARKRQLGFQAIEGGLSSGQKMELIYGPNSSQGSLFNSREELVQAWAACRDELLARANAGRRPAGFYEFEFDGRRPPYDTERSTLWRMGLLSADEKAVLEAEWKAGFEEAQAPDFTLNDGGSELLRGDCARAAHYAHHDIPRELIRRWEKAARRRRNATKNATKIPAPEKPSDTVSSVEGREEHVSGPSLAQPADH